MKKAKSVLASRWFWLVFLATWYAVWWGIVAFRAGADSFAIPAASDAEEYGRLAQNLLTFGRFTLGDIPPFPPETFRTPGYPLLAGLIWRLTGSWSAVTLMQIIILWGSAWFLMALGEKMFNRMIGLAAGVGYGLDPSALFHSLLLLSDTLFVGILVLEVYILFGLSRKQMWLIVVAGLLAGFLSLIRPIGLYLPVIIWPSYLLFEKRSSKSWRWVTGATALFAASFLVVVIPWIVRNYRYTKVAAFSSVGSYNLFAYNTVKFVSVFTNQAPKVVQDQLLLGTDLTSSDLRSLEAAPFLNLISRRELTAQWPSYLFYHLRGSLSFFFGSSLKTVVQGVQSQGWWSQIPFFQTKGSVAENFLGGDYIRAWELLADQWLLGVELFGWAAIGGLAVLAFAVYGWRSSQVFVLAAIVGYFSLLTGPVAYSRYRLPAEPFLFLLAAVGLVFLVKKLQAFWPISFLRIANLEK